MIGVDIIMNVPWILNMQGSKYAEVTHGFE